MNDLQDLTKCTDHEMRFYNTAYRDGYDAALDVQHRYVFSVALASLVMGLLLGSLM